MKRWGEGKDGDEKEEVLLVGETKDFDIERDGEEGRWD